MYSLLIIILFVLIIYMYGTNTFDYWKSRGIKHDPPVPFFGTNIKRFLQRATQAMVAAEVYRRYPEEKVVGFYNGRCPVLIVRDPEIIKRILVTDFKHFQSRGISFYSSRTDDIMTKSLLFVDGDLWRSLKQTFNPAFSAATLRSIFPLITERTERLQLLAEEVSRLEAFDMQELMARFTTEVIGAYAFGLDMDCLGDEHSQFRKLSKKINKRTLRQFFVFILKALFPSFTKNITFFDSKIIDSVNFLVKSAIKKRNHKLLDRNDFINVFLKLKLNVTTKSEANKDNESPVTIENIDESILVAQIFIFFAAGFDTSAKASSFTLHQLAFHPEYQENVQKEIDIVLAKHNNKISYEAVLEMKYLQMAFSESMRMNPPAGLIGRMCTSNEYEFPEINLTINKGVKIIIPIEALHNDVQYFEEPDKFKPERFDKLKNEIPNYVYMPFGAGPRVCIGARLGQMQSLAGLAAVLQKFTVEPASCTQRNPPRDPKSYFVEAFIGGLPLKLRKRKS